MPTSSRSGGYPRLNGGGYFALFHSTCQFGSVGFGSMEGIDPYIPSELHTIQPGGLKPSGFGRLVAAPTNLL